MSKDVMKKAEDLAREYAKKIWQGGTRPYKTGKASSADDYLAGYLKGLELHEVETKMLLDTLEEISKRMPELSPEQECIGNRAIAALAIKSYYQTDEGE